MGAITLPLLERCGAFTAVELDRDVIPALQAAAKDKGHLHLIQADALKTDFLLSRLKDTNSGWWATCPTTSPLHCCSTAWIRRM